MPVFAVGRRLDDLDLPAVFFAKKEDDAMRIFGQFPNGATSADWRKKIIQTFGEEGWSVPAFDRVTVNLKNAKKVTGGGGKGKLWLPILGCGFPSPLKGGEGDEGNLSRVQNHHEGNVRANEGNLK